MQQASLETSCIWTELFKKKNWKNKSTKIFKTVEAFFVFTVYVEQSSYITNH